MKATSSQVSQSPVISRSSTRRSTANGSAEDNHDDSIVNRGQPKGAISSKNKKRIPLADDDDDIDIPVVLDLVKSQGEEIVELKKTVQQLNLKVDTQSQLIEVMLKGMRSSFLSCESVWKQNKDELVDETPGPSTSGGTLRPSTSQGIPRRGPGRPRGTFKDLVRSPRKRGRPSKQLVNLVKIAKIQPSSRKLANGVGMRNTVQDDEEPHTSAAVPGGSGSSSRIREKRANGDGDSASDSDDEVKDTSFVPYKMKHTVKDLKSKFRNTTEKRGRGRPKLVKKEKHRCKQCGKFYQTKGVLKTHIRSVHGRFRYECPHCPGKFAQYVQLECHKKLHGKGGPPLEKCRVCGMELNGQRGVKIHMAVAHKIYAGTLLANKEVAETRGDESVNCQNGETKNILINSVAEEELDNILDAVNMDRKKAETSELRATADASESDV